MQRLKQVSVLVQNIVRHSTYLERDVLIDIYLPAINPDNKHVSLLIINDGQDLPKFHFDQMLGELYEQKEIEPIPVSYTHLRAHETGRNLVCRLLLEKK